MWLYWKLRYISIDFLCCVFSVEPSTSLLLSVFSSRSLSANFVEFVYMCALPLASRLCIYRCSSAGLVTWYVCPIPGSPNRSSTGGQSTSSRRSHQEIQGQSEDRLENLWNCTTGCHARPTWKRVRASSVHDHFGTYHFGTGFSPNSKFGPLRYMYYFGTCNRSTTSVYTTSVHWPLRYELVRNRFDLHLYNILLLVVYIQWWPKLI